MALGEYQAALKLGRRQYQEAVLTGKAPYLPVLDELLEGKEIVAEVSLGVMDIPLDKIVGTKTAGRTTAFSNQFMPLLPEKSEFAAKWAMLYDHQIDEGIHDPIVVYEYMNKFYVQEGNKRVSVMKFVGAYSIASSVTRLIPKRSEEKKVKMYYEFLDFYQVSSNYDITFSKEGNYRKLLDVMGRNPEEKWDDETRMMFRSTYGRFAKAFELAKGDRLDLTCGDAFLIYLELTGYEETKGQTEREMYEALKQMWEEIQLASRGSQVALVENPDELAGQKKNNLFNWLLPSGKIEPEMLTIGFIHAKTGATSSWTYAHELGRMHLEQVFDGKMKTMAFEQVNTEEETEKAIEEAIAAGCNTIFATASEMVNQCVRSAIRHPEVRIYNCSIRMSYSSICTYYARMYEAKFLTGAIAAAMSKCDDLGYIADYPVYGNIANINAFAMGARMINPDVKVHLEWSRLKGADPEERFEEQGIHYISGADMIVPEHRSREFGLYRKAEDGTVENIAMPVWHWGKFYERIVKNICQGIDTEAMKGKKAVNYWWGLSADVIDVICTQNMPHGTHRLIEFLKNSIRAGSFEPFEGFIYSQSGNIECKDGERLSPQEIITMNWLAENVIGRIPEADELTDDAQRLLQLQGVHVDEEQHTEG